MHARVVTGQLSLGTVDDAIRLWRETVAPSAKQQPGFRGARLLVNRETGAVLSMGLWETKAHFDATVAWNQERVAAFAAFFAAPPSVADYEVAGEA